MSLCDIVPFGQLSLRLCTGATVTREPAAEAVVVCLSEGGIIVEPVRVVCENRI